VFFVYVLRCADESLYVGHTDDLQARKKAHDDGFASSYTAIRRPTALVYSEPFSSRADAIRREKQLKRWSGQKKKALIDGDLERVKTLGKCRTAATD
jgi:predicted GIY-YIG superfamily endonuclease